ncbi:MAG TPA: GNAT family N-acetyltransferase [Solirubrobacteraceae bacterium]|nr:GNAT family N-acetyltransferase [Solirubrobacteraceae bacterium]
MRLARAAPDDIDWLARLARDPAVEPYLAVGSGDPEVLRRRARDGVDGPQPAGVFVIVTAGGRRAGGLALSVSNRRSRICELSSLMVEPGMRRAGIGRAAVALACQLVLDEHGMHRLQAEVYGDNLAAQALFTGAGFVCEGARRRAYWRRGRWLDGVLFARLSEDP